MNIQPKQQYTYNKRNSQQFQKIMNPTTITKTLKYTNLMWNSPKNKNKQTMKINLDYTYTFLVKNMCICNKKKRKKWQPK